MDKNEFSDSEKRDLKLSAETLRSLLKSYARTDASAKQCLGILAPLLKRAEQLKLDESVDDVPCRYTFHEGELRRYSDLEEAYSDFSNQASGVNLDDDLKRMREQFPDFE